LAQRLARRVCGECAETVEVNPEILVNIGVPAAEALHMKVKQGKGCSKCAGTGYKGRIALYEVMPMVEQLREFVLNGASAAEIKREAAKLGMMTLRASGLMRLKEGVTTIEEVLRVTAPD
jgi:type IV pilus assembly protein PilB